MGSQRGDGKVSPTLRPHLAREYAALDAAGKARFKENVRLVFKSSELSSSSDADELIMLVGDKTGSETIAGHKCDVYKRGKTTVCMLPQAPRVMLRWTDEKQGVSIVAKKITLNGPIPAAAGLLPKGVRWKKEPYDDADFILGIWSLKKPESDPAAVPGATLAKFAVGYLASPAATAELREMGAGMESGSSEDTPSDDGSSEAEAAEE